MTSYFRHSLTVLIFQLFVHKGKCDRSARILMHRFISVTCQVVSLTLQCMSVCPSVCPVLCEFVLSKDVFDKDNKDNR